MAKSPRFSDRIEDLQLSWDLPLIVFPFIQCGISAQSLGVLRQPATDQGGQVPHEDVTRARALIEKFQQIGPLEADLVGIFRADRRCRVPVWFRQGRPAEGFAFQDGVDQDMDRRRLEVFDDDVHPAVAAKVELVCRGALQTADGPFFIASLPAQRQNPAQLVVFQTMEQVEGFQFLNCHRSFLLCHASG